MHRNALLRTRIAPTPSGYLHMGNVFSFVLTWMLAKQQGGRVVLRIDDLDAARMRRAYLEDIFETLDWLGLQPDEGPCSVEDFLKHHSQQHRIQHYENILQTLRQMGVLFACRCSRKTIMQHNRSGIYPGICLCKSISFDEPGVAWRMALGGKNEVTVHDEYRGKITVNLAETSGDFVVRRKEGIPAYHVASVCDDLHMQINCVVRGEDLLASTATQYLLAERLGETTFGQAQFYHHPLLTDEVGKKLSKSTRAPSIRQARHEGLTLPALLEQITQWLRLPPFKGHTLGDLLHHYHANKTGVPFC